MEPAWHAHIRQCCIAYEVLQGAAHGGTRRTRQKEGLALELGSGCGILGVFLGTIYDVCSLQIGRNCLSRVTSRKTGMRLHVARCALDWASSQDLEDLMKSVTAGGVRRMYCMVKAVDHLVQLCPN